jgi:septal ring-binding cell division protein DamX
MDPLLAALAQHLGVPPEEARPALDAALAHLRRALDADGVARLDGVGAFVDDGVSRRFEPDPVLLAAVNGAYAGLAPVAEHPAPPVAPAPVAPPGDVPLVAPTPVAPAAPPGAGPTTPPEAPPPDVPPLTEPAWLLAADVPRELPDDAWFEEEPRTGRPGEALPGGAPLNVDLPVEEGPAEEAAPFVFPTDAPAEEPDDLTDDPDEDLDATLAGVWAPPPSPPVAPLDVEPPPTYEEAEFAVVPLPPEPLPDGDPAGYGPDAAPDEAWAPPPSPYVPEPLPEPVEVVPPPFAATATAPAAAPFATTAPAGPQGTRPPAPAEPREGGGRRALLLALPLLLLVALATWLWLRRGDEPPAVAEVPPAPAAPRAIAPDTLAGDSLRGDSLAADSLLALVEEPPPAGAAPEPPAPPVGAAPPRPAPPAPAPRPAPVVPPAPARPEPPEQAGDEPAAPVASGLRGSSEVDASAGGATWVVNSTTSAEARMQAERYRGEGFRTGVLRATVGGRRVYRVAVGQFATVAEAEQARGGLPPDTRADAWILRLGRTP